MTATRFKSVLRNLWKNRTFTAINTGGLVIGLAVAVMILWWVKSELSYDNYHSGADKIYRIKVRNCRIYYQFPGLQISHSKPGKEPEV